MSSRDERFMQRALELAARGGNRTAPNPLVGAVVVRGGRIVGEGWHRVYGGPHAEVHAIRAAGARAKGAVIYVSLEPCSPHPKKTPPCTDLLARAGIARAVVAIKDPNPLVHGRGLMLLRRAGIKVTTGVCAREAAELNAPFIKVHTRGLPYVAVKWAMTLDGKIATRTGDSRWVSSERSRAWLHRWRDTFHAILVGSGTLLRDDPRLRGTTSRPTRIILDTTAKTPIDAVVVRTAREQPTILAVAPGASEARLRRLRNAGVQILELDVRDLRLVFEALAGEGLHKILVEGGGEVHASVLQEAGLVDEACVFIAPKIIGGRTAKTPVEGDGLAAMADALRLEAVSIDRSGDDVVIRGRLGQ
ncbi:MAG: bifunctional diaminohydroxyphosphoribosylaminopyrimidine deaminase/5-amino-6-(5-phosphoribosylamino)uracil reductase RibD [Planctomycetota bacterium]|nr:MAG: bifunctional diaminohydroxyphosphoribosylaminopyrimidine deaminase/5-amino-6-(5-phosphoribosylamino)uracil reductase RibD [Planctomycetota bacterium]